MTLGISSATIWEISKGYKRGLFVRFAIDQKKIRGNCSLKWKNKRIRTNSQIQWKYREIYTKWSRNF